MSEEPTSEEIEELLKKKRQKLEELEKTGKNNAYIKELSDIALLELELNRFEESKNNLLICLKHFKKQKDRIGQAALYGILGILKFKQEDHKKSIEYYQEALNIYKELNQPHEQIICLKGIGNNLIKLKEYDEACDVFLDCSAICSDNNDIYNLLDCIGHLIDVHETLEKWDVLYELYLKALEAFKELNDIKGIITSYFNLGLIDKRNKNYDNSLLNFKKGTNKAIDGNYQEFILRGLSYVGEILFYQGKIKEAQKNYFNALKLAKKIGAKNAIIQLEILLKSLGVSEKKLKKFLETNESNKES
ncbi:MAG: tetratricopeptide repeat protein [Candidatus Lokiarchaeota archaeon]|nr:tetratricopeptide repeat protein [Candidatus Lokiarchaeota archaeon]